MAGWVDQFGLNQRSLSQCGLSTLGLGDRGLWVALAVIGVWMSSTVVLFRLDLAQMPIGVKFLGLVWQIFLYTGLFVTAHDGMHGSIAPSNRALNDAIGRFVLLAYAMFPFGKMRQMHDLHHEVPCREGDPDFHNGRRKNFFAWYFNFMQNYWSWVRLGLLIAMFHVIHQVFRIPEVNLSWFWVFPSVLSSFQLFLFGTFLPHREPKGGYVNEYRATSTPFSEFWSFISCYHFGYHEEHHALPQLGWWQLPGARRSRILN
jgi:beta-carotene/zeaxanthin 4-ketolase